MPLSNNTLAQPASELDREPIDLAADADLLIELTSLQQIGADRFNTVSFQLIEKLVDRAGKSRATAERLLIEKARLELNSYQKKLCSAQREAAVLLKVIDEHFPDSRVKAQQLAEAFNYKALSRLYRRLLAQLKEEAAKNNSLSSLVVSLKAKKPILDKQSTGLSFDEYLQQRDNELIRGLESVELSAESDAQEALPELRSSRMLRQIRLKQKAEKLVSKAIEESPPSPGPLNPQMLSIRALKGMRDLSPQYLNRLVTYIDSLLWIEKAGDKYAPEKKARQSGKGKSRKKPT